MGWTTSHNWQTRADIIADRVKTQHWTQGDHEVTDTVIAHAIRGNCLWKVHERNTGGKIRRYIGLDLIRSYGKEEGYGYKDMDESVHPYYYTCPLKYLDMVPEVSSAEWREKVRQYHAIRSIKLRPGLIVGLTECVVKAVELVEQRKEWVGRARDGRLFKIKRSYLSGQTYETWPEGA